MLTGWGVWAALLPVTVYEVSQLVRLERDAATFPIQASAGGRVVATTLRVGQPVVTGETLVELEVEGDATRLPAERTRVEGLTAHVSRLRLELDAERSARAEERESARVAEREAEGRISEARSEAEFAGAELTRMERLFAQGLIAERAIQQTRAEAQRLRARIATLQSAAQRVTQDQRTRDRERDVRLARLESEITALEGEQREVRANVSRLSHEVERRVIRAPVSGTVGEAAQIRPGAVVAAGERLGSIVPQGDLIAVAQFPADRALGRVRPGQPAQLRLAAYPWTEFGTVRATVATVASEVRDGNVRVELRLHATAGFRGRLDHGMPGTVEIAAERLTPLSLVLRIAGQTLSAPR